MYSIFVKKLSAYISGEKRSNKSNRLFMGRGDSNVHFFIGGNFVKKIEDHCCSVI